MYMDWVSLCVGIFEIETPLVMWRLAIRGCSEPLVNWFSAFSDKPSLKIAKLPVCYTLKFSSLNLVVRAILISPYLGRLSGPFLSDSEQWDNMLGV